MQMLFKNREDAGRRLAAALAGRGLEQEEPVVLALPRGGVPVAAEVAQALGAPLDIVLVRKIGAPAQPELAIAALADGAEPALEIDESTLAASGVSREYVNHELPRQLQELERRRRVYLEGRPSLDLRGRTVVVVDDGIATGTTVRAAVQSVRARQPRRIVLAVPVAPASELPALRTLVDELVCLYAPEFFGAVGRHYVDFEQTGDDEVVALLRRSRAAGDRLH